MTDRPAMRVPPNSAEAERAVLGGILLENAGADVSLAEEDFYQDRHARIWNTMQALFRAGMPVDTVTLCDAFTRNGQLNNVGGTEYLLSLTDTIPTVANIEAHAKIVRNLASVRRLIVACHEVAARGYGASGNVGDYLDEAESELLAACAKRDDDAAFDTLETALVATFQDITSRAEARSMLRGVPTGITKLDRITAGYQTGLIIIAGRPGMGKTAYAMGAVKAAARYAQGKGPVLVYSIEMPKEQLAERELASEAGVDGGKLRIASYITREEWPRLTRAAQDLSSLDIRITDKPNLSLQTMMRMAKRVKAREGAVRMVVIDYLQLMSCAGKFESREREVSEMSRQLKIFSKLIGAPVVALAQLNRGVENRGKSARPQLADLRESGAIEQDADLVIFVHREEVYDPKPENKGIAEFIVGKQRGGQVGTIKAKFDASCTRFLDLEEHHEQRPPAASGYQRPGWGD